MADLKKKFKMHREQLEQAKELKKKIDEEIKEDSKQVKGFFRRRKYIKLRANDYDQICSLYGRKMYVKVVSEKKRQQSLVNSINQKRYMDIFDIHGEDIYNNKLPMIMKDDITFETDDWKQKLAAMFKYYFPQKAKKTVKDAMGLIASIGTVAIMVPAASLVTNAEIKGYQEGKEHKTDIVEYLDDIRKYSDEAKKYELTPLQTMMKITEDMWSRIDGYGNPEIDLKKYAGMDVSKEMGVGVCRNMADDCARRLNAIDSKYNARVIPVFAEKGGYIRADIPMKRAGSDESQEIADKDDTVVNGSNPTGQDITPEYNENDGIRISVKGKEIVSITDKDVDEFLDEYVIPHTGNHAVVLVDIEEDGVTLVLDPTNAGVGLYHNGKITMFNSMGQTHPLEMRVTPLGGCSFGLGKTLIEMPDSFLDSLGIYTEEELQELNKKYGVAAQNKAISQVKKISKSSYIEDLQVDGKYVAKVDKDKIQDTSRETSNEDIEK